MIGGIIITHAAFSQGLKEAVEMILGQQEYFEAIALREGDGITELMDSIRSKIAEMDTEEIIFFVDLFGATPCNAASCLSVETEFPVVTGVNMPVLLEFIEKRRETTAEAIMEDLRGTYEESFHFISKKDILKTN